jgi:5-formyltetrahydrofolate cyclo-ligase
MKPDLRRQLKKARLAISEADRAAYSTAIVKQLKNLINWPEVKSLHYFEPFNSLGEPNISPFIVYLTDAYPQLKLVAANGKTPPTEKFDVIIIPMLGFDPKTLHRIGYGGGYYDKFLAKSASVSSRARSKTCQPSLTTPLQIQYSLRLIFINLAL